MSPDFAATLTIDCPRPGCPAKAGVCCGFVSDFGPYLHEVRYRAMEKMLADQTDQ